jgi:hypothetical protein
LAINSLSISRYIILTVLLPLIIGLVIYILYRPTSIFFFNLLNETLFLNILNLRADFGKSDNFLIKWSIYSLPDGLWLFSFTNTFILLWRFESRKKRWILFSIPLTISLFHEFFQLIGLISGTFDLIDCFTYILFFLLSIKIFSYI